MLKRKLALLIAGGLVSVQAGLAGAQGTFPPSTEEVVYALLPAEVKYWAGRAAADPNPTGAPSRRASASGDTSGDTTPGRALLPAVAKYFAERERAAKSLAPGGGVGAFSFPRESEMDSKG